MENYKYIYIYIYLILNKWNLCEKIIVIKMSMTYFRGLRKSSISFLICKNFWHIKNNNNAWNIILKFRSESTLTCGTFNLQNMLIFHFNFANKVLIFEGYRLKSAYTIFTSKSNFGKKNNNKFKTIVQNNVLKIFPTNVYV